MRTYPSLHPPSHLTHRYPLPILCTCLLISFHSKTFISASRRLESLKLLKCMSKQIINEQTRNSAYLHLHRGQDSESPRDSHWSLSKYSIQRWPDRSPLPEKRPKTTWQPVTQNSNMRYMFQVLSLYYIRGSLAKSSSFKSPAANLVTFWFHVCDL